MSAAKPESLPRRGRVLWFVLAATVLLSMAFGRAQPAYASDSIRHTRDSFRHGLAATVRPNHPAILPVAAAIRAITTHPIEQLTIVNDVAHLLVDYDDDLRVWGAEEFHATLDEMLLRRRESGWLYLRDDCDGRAIFAAHLLASLGIPWRLEASYWKEHAWIVARVNGVDYDLLDLRRDAPETNRFSYRIFGQWFVRPSHRPPPFAWRRAWSQRTDRNLEVGLRLGLLSVDSTPARLHERYATDWTVRVPQGSLSPLEDRVAHATVAGYPYGEPLSRHAIMSQARPPESNAAPRVTIGSASSAPAEVPLPRP